jgi:ribonuclease E
MEKQEFKSKWEELAREIGAEVTPEAVLRAEAHPEPAPNSGLLEPPLTPAQIPPLPKKAPADWASLAGDLGLPPIEQELPRAQEPPAKPPKREVAREPQTREPQAREPQGREPQSREPQSREPQSRGPRRGRGDSRRDDRPEEGREGRQSQGRGRQSGGPRRDRPEGRRDAPEKPREVPEKRRDEGEQRREVQEQRRDTRPPRRDSRDRDTDARSYDEPDAIESPKSVTPPPTPVREQPPKPPAVSLWHKIFGAPAEPTAKFDSIPAGDDATSETDERNRAPEDEFGGHEIRSLSGEEVTAAECIDEHTGEESTLSRQEADESERKRGRPRRRRRGGRGRKSGERQRDDRPAERVHESPGADEHGADFDDLGDDVGAELSDDDNDSITAASLDMDSDLDDTDADEETSGASRSMSPAQRAIPSWDEAIGFIVDSNMQSRSQRRPPSRSDSRGGPSRGGRSRGGRRK